MDYSYQDPSKSPSLVRALLFFGVLFYGGGQLLAWGTQAYLEREWKSFQGQARRIEVEIVKVDPELGVSIQSGTKTYQIVSRNIRDLKVGTKLRGFVSGEQVRIQGLTQDIPPPFVFAMLGFVFASCAFVPTAIFLSAAKFIGTHEINDFVVEADEDPEREAS